MKSKKNYIIILIYSILLIFLLLGFNNLYASSVDWITQHTIFPEYFRNLFYETKNLIPNLALNLGGGQNIFNLSYYGLMSPIVLISYFFPFLDMKIYISISGIILFILSGLLLYKFLSNHFENKISLYLSIIFLTLSSLTYHFHYHIMFVFYMPFLILSFIAVDKYIKDKKSSLLIISIFLLILTNYYYGATSIIVITIYGIYSLLKEYKNFRSFIIELLKASIRIIIPILLSCFILLPTAYVILNTGRINEVSITLRDLLVFNMKEIMYHSFSPSISFLILISLFMPFFVNKRKKEEVFLNTILLLVTFIPAFMYVLNGFLYARGKVLIPFSILYIISTANFIQKIIDKKINMRKLFIIIIIISAYIIITNYTNNLLLFIPDVLVTIVSILLYKKHNNIKILVIPLYLIILTSTIISNFDAKYLNVTNYKEITNADKQIIKLFEGIQDDTLYRSKSNINRSVNMNKIYTNNYYSTTIYSSSYNDKYSNFYNSIIGNNIPHRNAFMTSGSDNPLFNSFMGVKYIVSRENPALNYKKVKENGEYNLYRNDNVMPLIYVTNNYGTINDYKNLNFPYNIEYMLKYPVTDSKKDINYNSEVKKIDIGLEESYEFELDETKKIIFPLDSPIDNEYLIIKFNMDYNQDCKQGDVSITINREENKLTCKNWLYHNKNNTFEYVISSNEQINKLEITLTKGKYKINNIETYIIPNMLFDLNEIDNLSINKKDSIINASVDINEDSFVITSMPYDEGYKIYIDSELSKKEIVNTAFLGFKVAKGKHDIKIVYKSPWYNIGLLVSSVGLCLLVFIILIENKRVRRSLFKYKDNKSICYDYS